MDTEALNILDRILENTRREVSARRHTAPLSFLRDRPAYAATVRPFAAALRGHGLRVIAELKQASPSLGLIRADVDIPWLAESYERGGAAALSVLTDEAFFHGRLENLGAAKNATALPVLRKDFIVDAYQLHEARAYGADAALLIVAALDHLKLAELHNEATELGMDVLVEVHAEGEIAPALKAGSQCIGINNRDLRTFAVDISTTENLSKLIPPHVTVVSESGISTAADLRRLARAGVHAALIGEALMRAPDPGIALASLLAEARGIT